MHRSPLLRLARPSLDGQWRTVAAASGLTVATIGAELAAPWPLAVAVDAVLVSPAPPQARLWLVTAAAASLALAAGAAVLAARGRLLAESAAERCGADVRQRVFVRAERLSLRWHDTMASGELLARLTTDVGRVMDALVACTSVLVPETLALAAVVVALAVVEPRLAVVALVALPPLMLVALRQRRDVRRAQQLARAAQGRLTATASEQIRAVAAVQAFGREDLAHRLFGHGNDGALRAELDAVDVQARWGPRAEVVLAVGSALVLVVGGSQVLAGRLSVGALLVVLAYTRDLYSPVRSLARLSGSLAKAGASADRLLEVLDSTDEVPERPGAVRLAPQAHRLAFESVDFGYGDRRALRGLDLHVGAAETVCLLGPSGSGKSTALSLALRLHDPDAGRVTIDGVDVRDLALADLRRHVALVPQDAWLFDGTLAENIAFGSARAGRADVVRAARAAALDDLVAGLPLGFDTPLGEAGGRLSGGQRRRVAIARAIVADRPVLLLDEPTASLDAATAAAVVDSVRSVARHRTVLVATHDPALTSIADRVVHLDRPEPPDQPGPPPWKEVHGHEDLAHQARRHPAPRPRPQPQPQPLAQPQPFARLTHG